MDTRQDSGISPTTQSLNMMSLRGAPRAGARGTFGFGDTTPKLQSAFVPRSGTSVRHPHSSTGGSPWPPAEAGGLYRQLFFKGKILALAWGGCLGWVTIAHSIDINPSKYQGGSTNDIPHKTEAGAHSLFPNALKWIFGSPHSTAMERIYAPPHFKVELSTQPKDFPVTTNAVLKTHMTITNQGDKYILEFNTAQHYDFIINNKDGKEFYRYSNDKVFSQEPSSVVLNRNEKLVYEEVIFSPTHQTPNLPPGEYNLIGQVTATIPISVEISFRVVL